MGTLSLTITGADGSPQSWSDVETPLTEITTWANTTKLSYVNVQTNGLRADNIRTHAGVEGVRVKVRNASGGTIGADSLIYFSGTYSDGSNNYPTIGKAVAASSAGATYLAQGVTTGSIANNADGTVALFYESDNLNTSASSAVGAPVYLSAVAGAYTFTEPTSEFTQVVGIVTVDHASTGRIIFSLGSLPQEALALTSYAKLASPALTGTPTAPTADSSINTTQIATTAYVTTAVSAVGGGSLGGSLGSTDNAVPRTHETGGSTLQATSVLIDDSNNVTGVANLTASGELDGATLDISGNADIDGTLEADAITVGGANLTTIYQPLDADLTAIAGLSNSDGNFIVGSASGWVAESGATARTSLGLGTMAVAATSDYSVVAGSSSIVTTGALNSGSITSGFGNINIGSSTITTTGALASGATTVTGTLAVGNGATSAGKIEIYEDTDDGAHKLTLTTPALAGDVTLTFPNTDGDADQVLTTDGSGALSWSDAGGGAYSDWAILTDSATVATKAQVICNKATAMTVTLPSSPSPTNTVTIKNVGAGTVTVGRNGKDIDSVASDGTLLTNSAVQLVFVNDTFGWVSL